MSLDTDARAAVVARLDTVSGLPAASAWAGRVTENLLFDPPTSASWLRLTMQWGLETLKTRPARDGLVFRAGSTRVELYEPVDPATSTLETMTRAVLDAFPPGLTLVAGSETLQVLASRRWTVARETAWAKVDVDIDWTIVSRNTLT